jgi:hypothetical protein
MILVVEAPLIEAGAVNPAEQMFVLRHYCAKPSKQWSRAKE